MNPSTGAASPPVLACGQELRLALSHRAAAVLSNCLGRYGDALAAALSRPAPVM